MAEGILKLLLIGERSSSSSDPKSAGWIFAEEVPREKDMFGPAEVVKCEYLRALIGDDCDS